MRRVRLLTGHLLNHLFRERPPSRGCATCGRPWTVHTDPEAARHAFPCSLCGAWLDPDCHRAHMVADELARWMDDDNAIFLCAGCRS